LFFFPIREIREIRGHFLVAAGRVAILCGKSLIRCSHPRSSATSKSRAFLAAFFPLRFLSSLLFKIFPIREIREIRGLEIEIL
jgi:hypothetical protein